MHFSDSVTSEDYIREIVNAKYCSSCNNGILVVILEGKKALSEYESWC